MFKSKGIKILIIILVILIVIAVALLALKIVSDKNKETGNTDGVISLGVDDGRKEEKKETIKIYNGVQRPIAVMIDNHKGAWPQAGLNEAYMVYEIIVEGGETRLMAVFKGKNLDKIGPIRSSRHYFLDYALENDAIYVHYGWSPQAESDISTLKVNNINGITESSKAFWRVKDKTAPHNVATKTEYILNIANKKGYRTTSNAASVLNYKQNEIELQETEGAVLATNITIPYKDQNKVSYKYNEQTKMYERYSRNTLQTDWDTKKAIATKNIIITFAKNYQLADPENKDRQGLNNIGTLNGYYITNGKAIKITCTKNSRTDKTVYKDLAGNIIEVNDGNTFVQICPIDSAVVIE